MQPSLALTLEELALLGLVSGDPLPDGGQSLAVTVRSGSGTAVMWSHLYGLTFRARFNVSLWPGTLNLWTAAPVEWDNPTTYLTHEFCPIILEESAVGIVLRWADPTRPRNAKFLEVLSPVELRPRLNNVQDGQIISVRLLPGDLLK